jgi:hypothetical protein
VLGEEFETEVWLNISFDMKHIGLDTHDELISKYSEVRKMLISGQDRL